MPANAAAETLKQRKAKFDPLVKLMEQTIEAISFVLLLIEFNLPITLSKSVLRRAEWRHNSRLTSTNLQSIAGVECGIVKD
jgi:hypothetical protein